MTDFVQKISRQKALTQEEQKKAGKPLAGKMDSKYKEFLATLKKLISSGEIDPLDPKSFLQNDVYASLDETWQEKTDLSLINISSQIKLIHEFLSSNDTPDESPQLQTMVEQLWAMKQSIEEYHDVFKF